MPRIFQTAVPPLFPRDGAVRVLLLGEAPGPRGADQSGIPFWGDRAGRPVYRALVAAGLARVPEAAWLEWDGARFREEGLRPEVREVALSNAFPSCPTSDGEHFRAPTDAELRSEANQARLRAELAQAAERCPGTLRVLTLGRRAAWLLERLEGGPAFELHALPHPSAQGLLQAAPGKGKGLKLADLEGEWEIRLRELVASA